MFLIRNTKYFAVMMAFAVCAGLSAQTIPTPANSADSGGRAVVSITSMTSTEITKIVNDGIAAGTVTGLKHWTQYFVGQTKCSNIWCMTINSNYTYSITNHGNNIPIEPTYPWATIGFGALGCDQGVYMRAAPVLGWAQVAGAPPTSWTYVYATNPACGGW